MTPRAAGKIEPLEFGNFELDGRAENQRRHQRQPDQQAEHVRPDRDQPATVEQLPARIAAATAARRRSPIKTASDERLKAGLADRPRNHQTAVGEKEAAEQRNALPRIRQRAEHREIPEQDLEQQRQVADQFDIAAGNPRQQPVRRQPAQRHDKPDHGRKEDADDRDQQRVEQADQKYPGVGVGSGIRNQVLADVKTRGVVEKSEAGRDPLLPPDWRGRWPTIS